jgi:hypothetical protein
MAKACHAFMEQVPESSPDLEEVTAAFIVVLNRQVLIGLDWMSTQCPYRAS